MLSQADRDGVRAALIAQRTRTEQRLARLDHDFAVIVEAVDLSPPDDEHDPEGATVGFERAQLITLRSDARAQLRAIELAEQRLETASYGRCERCGQAIAAERLLARPTATTCVSCSA